MAGLKQHCCKRGAYTEMMISDNNLPTDASVLVMLDADCAQPCYTFGGRNEYSEKLSVDGLRNAFRWIAQQVPFSRDVRLNFGRC